jgi:hypothetical protein
LTFGITEREIAEAKEQAADYNYRQGVHFSMLSSEAATQRQAAGYFKAALSYIPDYKDSALRYEKRAINAIRRIAILPFEDKSGSQDRYGAIYRYLCRSDHRRDNAG